MRLSELGIIMKKLIILILLLSGCAVKPVSSIQTKDSLIISLSGSDKNRYRLVDQRGGIVSTVTGANSQLSFRVPKNTNLNQCFAVIDKDGKPLTDHRYKFSLINEFRTVSGYKRQLDSERDGYIKNLDQNRKNLDKTIAQLDRNRAFADRRCHLPKQRSLPPEPYTKCSSYSECLEEGAAICYSRFIGVEGCGLALRELNVSGMLASPGCAAVAANLAGEKYNMDDAFVDLLHGVADDMGTNLVKSDSWFNNALGVFVLGLNYSIKLDNARQCKNTFVERHYGPKRRWITAVNDIRAEPGKTKSQCMSLVDNNNWYIDQMAATREKITDVSARLTDARVVYNDLAAKKIYSPQCSVKGFGSKLVVNNIKRYLIGANIQDFKKVGSTITSGVEIISLVENMPAKAADLREGDVIIALNGRKIKDVKSMMSYVQNVGATPLAAHFKRDGALLTVTLIPKAKVISLGAG